MDFYPLRSRLALIVIGCSLMSGSVFADQLLMENGDIISGNISKIVDGKVFIKPSYGDEYAVSMDAVTSIDADQPFDVELVDGSTIDGRFAGAEDGEQTLIVDEKPMSVEISELAAATDPTQVPVVKPWEGTGEFGLVNTTGNTESVAVNFRLNFVRTGERWRHRFTGTALNTSEDGINDNERYTVEIQSDRKLNDKSWLFGAFRWDADKFGSYDPQTSLSAGYGYQLMKSDRHEMKGEIGLGYRRLDERVSGDSSSEAIGRFLLDDWWQIFGNTAWTNRLLVETGSSNTYTQFDTGLTVSMTDSFAVKLGFQARNNTKIPPGDTEHTDTITSANVVYNF